MKIAPIARPGATPANPDEGHSAGADRIARAKAVLSGGTATVSALPADRAPPVDPQVARAEQSIKRIRMRVNATPTQEFEAQPPVENVAAPEGAAAPGNIADPVEATAAAPEVTKPLSPQFAALARKERALQVKEREILAREQALSANGTGTTLGPDLIARLKADPLSVLDEQGVTYDQLTEAILTRSQNQNIDPKRLEAEILKKVEDAQATRDQASKVQVLAQIEREVTQRAAKDDAFELVREAGYQKKVVELIDRTFEKTGEVLDTEEALTLIEAELEQEALKYTKTKKLQAKLAPAQPLPEQSQNPKQIRTLTARDGASPTLSRRERAILAAQGRLN